ncbi:HlyD family efflux transporter periplasmic adaptor subunit [Bizionia argentinensis JUB59]|uniref:HlyD family efflux transporter periplasmic adaptor subunit n=1 Tax=Bizionia argentinensis JUB59 TaxID=1046627 RepID=G2EFG2_9FLAO|nr:HlyD family efflux transporter periplasmic adaptor subunit [Bizionia argentinensis]EGV42830.1 HlyD family efflux transporter periplasmic adaptor subunit [Bizionia argentinensis JUB59]
MPNRSQHIEIRSEEVQEILSYVPNWMIRWGNTLFLLLILMLLFITWFIKYPDIISTSVTITTTFPPEKIYANTSGKFDAILVEDGDSITSNQTLAILENTALYEDVFLLKRVIDTFTINRNNFSFPIEDLPPLLLGNINSYFYDFENNYSEYILNIKLNPFKNQSSANQLSLIEAKGRLRILYSQKELNSQELEFKEKSLIRQKGLFDKGIISAKDFEQKQIEFLQAQKEFKSVESSISQIRELISNSTKNLRGTSIEKTQQESRLLKQTIQSFYQLKEAIKDWEKEFVLRSSIPGKLSFLSFWDKNQTVQKGDLVFTVIPTNGQSFIGKIVAPAANSGKIQKGQTVQIKLSNYPSDEYGELNGKVQSISLMPNQDGNYLIDVELPVKLITTYNKKIAFRQEMTGVANIVTEDLRLIERFFYQLKNIIQ